MFRHRNSGPSKAPGFAGKVSETDCLQRGAWRRPRVPPASRTVRAELSRARRGTRRPAADAAPQRGEPGCSRSRDKKPGRMGPSRPRTNGQVRLAVKPAPTYIRQRGHSSPGTPASSGCTSIGNTTRLLLFTYCSPAGPANTFDGWNRWVPADGSRWGEPLITARRAAVRAVR